MRNRKDKIKVLTVGNHKSVKGGITSVIQQILSFDWNAVGVDMYFIPTYISGSLIKRIIFYIIAYIKIYFIIKRYNIDIVHIHMSYKGSFFRAFLIHKLCRKNNVTDIVHLHGSEFKSWYESTRVSTQLKVKQMLRECSSFIVLGNKWNSVVKQIEPTVTTSIISNSVHVSFKSAKWSQNKFQILFLGVLIKRKGIHDLLNALGLLKKNNQLKNLKVIIAGSGPEKSQLLKLTDSLGLSDIVDFVGWTDDSNKESYFLDSQILVLPSYNEGLPIAILEALSYGLPIIASSVGDVPYAVEHSINGFLFLPGDVNNLAEYIFMLSSDKSLYEKMSISSKKIAIRKFSDTVFFDNLLHNYQNLLKKSTVQNINKL